MNKYNSIGENLRKIFRFRRESFKENNRLFLRTMEKLEVTIRQLN
jgi:hypothetical protein